MVAEIRTKEAKVNPNEPGSRRTIWVLRAAESICEARELTANTKREDHRLLLADTSQLALLEKA
jgi:hypothetical protein